MDKVDPPVESNKASSSNTAVNNTAENKS
jgi:hypothetical protein